MECIAAVTLLSMALSATATAEPEARVVAAPPSGLVAAQIASLRGEWAQAEAQFRTVLATSPKLVEAHQGLAFVLAEQGKPEAAAAAYEAAVALSPRDALLLYNAAAAMDRVDARRALPLWARYIAVATAVPAERVFVDRARARVRQLVER